MSEQTSETLVCFLCKGIVSYKDCNPSKFNKHMNTEHNAYYGLEYLLAGCTMSNEERMAVREVTRDRTDTPVKEREEAKEKILEKKFKPSETRKKKCPNCPISFVFQADLSAHLETSHPDNEDSRMKSSSDEEGGRSLSEQTLDSVDSKENRELVDKMRDSKENRELVDKIRDFNAASQLLKEKANGGSAPETMKKGSFERGKGLTLKKFGPVRGAKMTKEEAWKAATKRSTRGSLSKEEKENSAELESPMSEESGSGKPKKEPLRDIKKRLENKTFVKVTPVKGKKLKLKNKKFKKLQKIDRSRTPNKQIADANVDPGTGTSCPLCGKQFPKNGPMRRHFEDIHQPGEYPCPGEGCGKIFTSKNKMSSHRSRNCNPNNPKERRQTL